MRVKKIQVVGALLTIACLLRSTWNGSIRRSPFNQSHIRSSKVQTTRLHLTFHFIHTTNAATFRAQNVRAIESVFYHHPNATVIIHCMDMNITTLQPLRRIRDEAGYALQFEAYHLEDLINTAVALPNSTINKEAARVWMGKVETYSKTKF